MRDMGRIFEVRKHAMFARWNRMAKQFTRVAKDIAIAVHAGGPDPAANPTLRRVLQNARAVNMPKDKTDAAIRRASGKEATNYAEILYEGYAPHGVALLVETATDNPTRTVGSLRNNFGKLQEALEARGIAPLSAEHEYICSVPTELPEDQAAEVLALIDRLEQDDDVQKVFHTLA